MVVTSKVRPRRKTIEVPLRGPQVPFCADCGTDQFLILESYAPRRILPGGSVRQANVSYTCGQCDQFSGHEVPADWEPPGWFWYA